MTTFQVPEHPFEQNELNNLSFCKCGLSKAVHELDQIKSPVYEFFTAPEEVQRPIVEEAIEKASKEQVNIGGLKFDVTSSFTGVPEAELDRTVNQDVSFEQMKKSSKLDQPDLLDDNK